MNREKIDLESFIKRSNEIHNNKYDYNLVKKIDRKTIKKVSIVCPMHGTFEQNPYYHIFGKGCYFCNGGKKFTKEEFIKRGNELHNNKYDYSLVEYKNNSTNIKIICPVHGTFEQLPIHHFNKHGCPECVGLNKNTTENYIKQCKEIHKNKYDYSLVEYKNNRIKIKIICKKHGIFEQNPKHHKSGIGCPKCNESRGEKIIRNLLTEKNINFISQKKFDNCRYKLPLSFDFYLPNYNMCIEFDGNQHKDLCYT